MAAELEAVRAALVDAQRLSTAAQVRIILRTGREIKLSTAALVMVRMSLQDVSPAVSTLKARRFCLCAGVGRTAGSRDGPAEALGAPSGGLAGSRAVRRVSERSVGILTQIHTHKVATDLTSGGWAF